MKGNKTTAMTPDSLTAFQELRDMRTEAIRDETGAEPDEAALADIVSLRGWSVIKEFIQDQKNKLDDALRETMGNGSSFEAIGAKAIVVDTVKEKLDAIIDYVESTAGFVLEKASKNK